MSMVKMMLKAFEIRPTPRYGVRPERTETISPIMPMGISAREHRQKRSSSGS